MDLLYLIKFHLYIELFYSCQPKFWGRKYAELLRRTLQLYRFQWND